MNIDISKIVIDKIKDMEEKKVVENAIEETIEKTIIKAAKDALEGYSLKCMIEGKFEKEVSGIVSQIGFTAYNGFIVEKFKQITEGVINKDIQDKIAKTFDEILVLKRDKIKLSEICDAYRDYMNDNTDEDEKYDLEYFYISIKEDEKYHWLDVKLAKEEPQNSYDFDGIKFTIHRSYSDKNMGSIGSLRIGGYSLDKTLNFGNMSDIERLLVNLKYNDTPIEIDVESEDDIDNYFDIDN
ncbi:hypothetical protein [Clostridium kluyveri]|uniref:Uncharacterized protein n=1 Tax=Clostridium kluyveri TaxID=1534 RepID=A0A1L5F9D5_CLOKL|nr:hypothetical protein [Clostridium kluyveri]APM39430.1 hypothetical protein BS101_12090 [Clostridium kluyveri]